VLGADPYQIPFDPSAMLLYANLWKPARHGPEASIARG
jgi:hypothetical protein